MKTDARLQEDVLDELDWDSSIDSSKIGVAADKGVITLSGHVNTYSQKLAAEDAAKRVLGVKAVVMNIDVKPAGSYERTDEQIAKSVLNSLEWNSSVPEEDVSVKVEKGWVTLTGKVEWNYQRTAATNAVNSLLGVKGVTNNIKIESRIEPKEVKEKIKKAFERNATIDADKIIVTTEGQKVILTGTVQSLAERKQAVRTAWSASGVTQVEDKLTVQLGEEVY